MLTGKDVFHIYRLVNGYNENPIVPGADIDTDTAWNNVRATSKRIDEAAATIFNERYLAPLQREIEMMKETYQHATRVAEDMLEKDRQRITELEQEKATLRGEVAKYASMQEYLLTELKHHRSTIHNCAIAEQQIQELEQENKRLQARVEEDEDGMPALPEGAQLNAHVSRGACPEMDWYVEFSKKASPEAMATITEQATRIDALEALVKDLEQTLVYCWDNEFPVEEVEALQQRVKELLKGA